jgi:hypothetical protein
MKVNQKYHNRTGQLVSRVLPLLIFAVSCIFYPALGSAKGFPETKISNGLVTAKIYLPDAEKGYYRSTRFDWSGAVYSLKYQGHEYYGPWYDRIDPKVINWEFRGQEIVAGPCSGLCGPVNEFQTVLGWNEAKPGGTFIKIGVGVLRKEGETYNRYAPYEVLNPGKWTAKKGKNSVEFIQELSDPATGYGYVYRKVVRLADGKPEMVIEQSLKNTGQRAIKSDVYNHNFVIIDKQPPGPDYSFKVPFEIRSSRPPNKDLVVIQGNNLVYQKVLSGEEEAAVFIQGFSNKPEDTEIVIENKKAGAGLKISGDRPLIRHLLWSIRTVLAVEPYISIDVEPGNEFTWNNMFVYYTLPDGK